MIQSSEQPGSLLLALHSCTDTLGVGLTLLGEAAGAEDSQPAALGAFPLGRRLSNQLLACVESILPAADWPRLGRIAVATGPGGFTGTRLTVVLARTLAQQLQLPLDGISGFHLIARRLWNGSGAERPASAPFWLAQDLPRHGLVAGLYDPDPEAPVGMAERLAPRLYRRVEQLDNLAANAPVLPATPLLPNDVEELLIFAQAASASGRPAPWQTVLPLYPTSPVE